MSAHLVHAPPLNRVDSHAIVVLVVGPLELLGALGPDLLPRTTSLVPVLNTCAGICRHDLRSSMASHGIPIDSAALARGVAHAHSVAWHVTDTRVCGHVQDISVAMSETAY